MTSDTNSAYASAGDSAGRISIRLSDGILFISVEDEMPGHGFLAVFREGIEAGWLQPDMPALVDLTRFTGSVDWAAVRAVRDLAPWGDKPGGRSRVAYLVRNSRFGMLVRVASVLFAKTRHRIFADPAEALDWLRRPNDRAEARRPDRTGDAGRSAAPCDR